MSPRTQGGGPSQPPPPSSPSSDPSEGKQQVATASDVAAAGDPADVVVDADADEAEAGEPAQGPYGSVDPRPAPTADGAHFQSPQHLLDSIAEHARTTHGLAADKQMFLKIYAYLKHHLTDAGFLEPGE